MNLKDRDNYKRVQYCRWFTDFLTANGDVLDVTSFSDEAWFHSSVSENSLNSHVWSAVNPHAIQETPLHDQNVWCMAHDIQ
jgi:hypothetical protein